MLGLERPRNPRGVNRIGGQTGQAICLFFTETRTARLRGGATIDRFNTNKLHFSDRCSCSARKTEAIKVALGESTGFHFGPLPLVRELYSSKNCLINDSLRERTEHE